MYYNQSVIYVLNNVCMSCTVVIKEKVLEISRMTLLKSK